MLCMRKNWVRSIKVSLRKIEAVLLTVGLALLAIFLAFRIHSTIGSRAALRSFTNTSRADSSPQPELREVDTSLWSEERIAAYKKSLEAPADGPIAVLTIPRMSLEVPVFNGTDEWVLNRGLGRIEGTAKPGEAGNIGIAGHRDGFFRCLKDIQLGDRIELATLNGKTAYVVDETRIVLPEDVGVLEPRKTSAITLVTCYPFYFVGSAPKRFIVHASIVGQDLPMSSKSDSKSKTTN
jgi:sortase A